MRKPGKLRVAKSLRPINQLSHQIGFLCWCWCRPPCRPPCLPPCRPPCPTPCRTHFFNQAKSKCALKAFRFPSSLKPLSFCCWPGLDSRWWGWGGNPLIHWKISEVKSCDFGGKKFEPQIRELFWDYKNYWEPSLKTTYKLPRNYVQTSGNSRKFVRTYKLTKISGSLYVYTYKLTKN